jgi:hypothetical protein
MMRTYPLVSWMLFCRAVCSGQIISESPTSWDQEQPFAPASSLVLMAKSRFW